MHGSVSIRSGPSGRKGPENPDPESVEGPEEALDEEANVEAHVLTVMTLDLQRDATGEGEVVVLPLSRQNDAKPWYRGWLTLRLSVDDEAA